MIWNIIHYTHKINNNLGEGLSTILFVIFGHNVDWMDKIITFAFSVSAGLFVHILKKINIGQLIIQLFKKKNGKKNNF